MRISKFKVSLEETKKTHLKEIDLSKKPLGSIVALVGKNGAGKSRILKLVENYVNNITREQLLEEHFQYFPSSIVGPTNNEFLKKAQDKFKILENLNPVQKNQFVNQINQTLAPIVHQFKLLGKAYIKVVDNDDLKNIKAHIGNNTTLTFEQILTNKHFDDFVSNPQFIQNNQKQIQSALLNEFSAFNNETTIQYLNNLTNEIITDEFSLYLKHRSNPSIISQEIKNKKAFKLFNKFQGYVKQFLGKEFSYQQTARGNTVNSILFYNDAPFDINLLSPGQKTLFAYAILFFYLDINTKTNIRESILIIDEPEKHLHPEAQITLINALKSIISESGQLWIATHSIHILSHLDYNEIFMVKDDEIIPPSRITPGKSFNDLMGIEDHISELISFINSISEWAYGNFMAQCFKEPEVVLGNNLNDPQFILFKEFLVSKININLMDYGAGKGRIGYTISEDSETSQKIKYFAMEPNKKNFELLNSVPNIQKVYSKSDEIPDNFFDCVLLCNVLHEINPNDWIDELFTIKRILKNDGYLLIVEDKFLPKGENAHQYGYLILGSEETKILLNSENSLELSINDNTYKDRILFNVFTQENIHPTKESLILAIKSLKENTYNKIKLIRKKEKDLNQGRNYANETQLYINSQLFLESMKKNKSTSENIL